VPAPGVHPLIDARSLPREHPMEIQKAFCDLYLARREGESVKAYTIERDALMRWPDFQVRYHSYLKQRVG
jgi:hypothetical protein